jgi:hypothetical protein
MQAAPQPPKALLVMAAIAPTILAMTHERGSFGWLKFKLEQ